MINSLLFILALTAQPDLPPYPDPHPQPDYCDFHISGADHDQVFYTWSVRGYGALRYGDNVRQVVGGTGRDVTCASLGIDPEHVNQAQWVWVIRHDHGYTHRDDYAHEFARIHPNGDACGMDINGDGAVNFHELFQVQLGWLSTAFAPKVADFNGDGVVNALDTAMLKEHWLELCELENDDE